MARPIERTPTLEGEDARLFNENADRVARGEITPEERRQSVREMAYIREFLGRLRTHPLRPR